MKLRKMLPLDLRRRVGYFLVWLSGLIGMTIGFRIAPRLIPGVSNPFFSDSAGIIFSLTVYTLFSAACLVYLQHVRKK
jgi:hypothetical protein